MSATLVASPFLIFSLFSYFEVHSSKAPSRLSCSGGPKELTFDLSFFKTSRYHLFRPTFWLLSFLSFFLNAWIPSRQAERPPATFPSWFIFRCSPKYQTFIYELLVPQVFSPFSVSLGGWWDTSALVLCVHGHASLSCFNPNLALLHISRISGL